LNAKSMIVIVSPPGNLQIGLQALLTSHFDVNVLVVGDRSSAMRVIERQNPALIILDEDISDDTVALLTQDINPNWAGIPCILLVNDDQSYKNIIARESNHIVIKGLPGAKLIEKIKTILNMQQE
jgi:DNA-binding NarL/FixJ family response regulator